MSDRSEGAVVRHVHTLFRAGSVSGLSDGQLLERFSTRRDESAEAAFAVLVARHGPMVLGVCRHLLGDPHAAEDAFQATFLVLVRKAGSIRVEDSLGRWLYGVSQRVAARARVEAARRRRKEASVAVSEPTTDADDPARLDLRPLLHEELNRLPEKYRAPVVLCHLEGLTHEQAARQLHWPVGTVRGRLSRARDLLRERLGRRGVTVPAVALSAVLTRAATAEAVPPALADRTARAAIGYATRGAAAGLVSASALSLTTGVLQTMFTTKLTTIAAGVLALGLLGGGTAGVVALGQSDEEGQAFRGAGQEFRVESQPKGETAPAPLDPLDIPVTVDVEQKPLRSILDILAKQTDSVFVAAPHPQVFDEVNRAMNELADLHVKDLSLRKALDVLLKPHGMGVMDAIREPSGLTRIIITTADFQPQNPDTLRTEDVPGRSSGLIAGSLPSNPLQRATDVTPDDPERLRRNLERLQTEVNALKAERKRLEERLARLEKTTEPAAVTESAPAKPQPAKAANKPVGEGVVFPAPQPTGENKPPSLLGRDVDRALEKTREELESRIIALMTGPLSADSPRTRLLQENLRLEAIRQRMELAIENITRPGLGEAVSPEPLPEELQKDLKTARKEIEDRLKVVRQKLEMLPETDVQAMVNAKRLIELHDAITLPSDNPQYRSRMRLMVGYLKAVLDDPASSTLAEKDAARNEFLRILTEITSSQPQMEPSR